MTIQDETQPTRIPAATLRALTSIGAAGLFAFGVFCWIAANWSSFHRLTKLELIAGLLAVSALAAGLLPRVRAPALLVATTAVGGLFALIGQTYPSGADAWQLFALWAALALPFALAARHDVVWVLWTMVADAAIGLWRMQESSGVHLQDFAPAWAMAAAVAAFLSPYAGLRRFIGDTTWAFRLASLGAIALIAATGFEGLFRFDNSGDAAFVAAAFVLCLATGGLALARPLEFGVTTLAFAGVDAVVIARLYKVFFDGKFEIGGALLLAILSTAIVFGSVTALRKIHAWAESKKGEATDLDRKLSWPLAALSGFGALLAALPVLSVYALLFASFIERPPGAAMVGVLTLIPAVFIMRGGAPFSFRQMFGLIMAAVSTALLIYALTSWFRPDAGFVLAALAIAVGFAVKARWMRALFGFWALWAIVASLLARLGWHHMEAAVALASLAAVAGAVGLAGPALGLKLPEETRPFFAGWTAGGLVALILMAGQPFLVGAGSGLIGELASLIRAPWAGPAQIVSIALGLAGAGLLLARRADLRTPLGFAVAAVMAALTFRSPALGGAIAIFAAAMLAPSRGLAGAAALAAVWIVSAFYYALSWPLTQKAYVLMALGVALGIVVFLTRSRAGGPALPKALGGAALALIALGAVATGAIGGAAVRSAEDVLANGRIVYIALRPVDPRSLIQGDYMAVAFDVDKLPAPREITGEVIALADVDARGIAKIESLAAPGVKPQDNQIAVKLRRKSNRWFVGTDAWFFEEGRADDFAKAKFGRFRVGSDGRLLLIAMTDENLKILP
ncbi:MAG TPA: GDYXXLXY domain-containing protein [Rhodoblastus sp.]|nr:GDYXXLXY domain-containing protein [Rhodoblastus sp.]